MTEKERRLGKGLEALIGAARDRSLDVELLKKAGHRVQMVATDLIRPNPFQPRTEFAEEPLNDLVESLRHHGLMQPIVVRRVGSAFELIAGERRWRAARELGWDQIEAVVVEADDRRMVEWALIENVQRQDLNPMELARALKQMSRDFGLTQEEIGKALGMSRPSIANLQRLLDLPESIQASVSRGTISMGAARALLSIEDPHAMASAAARVEKGELTVRQVEALGHLSSGAEKKTPDNQVDPNLAELASELQSTLGTKVVISGSTKRGRIQIHFHSARQLDGLVRQIRAKVDQVYGEAEVESED